MTIRVSDAFDGGNAEVLGIGGPEDIRLAIRRDAGDEFLQWFYFRVTGAEGRDLAVRIENASEAAYARGYLGYSAVASVDRREWVRVPTEYADGVLTLRYPSAPSSVYFAYFAPYSMERHADLIARCAGRDGVELEVLGGTLDGQDLDLLRLGRGPLQIWAIARQHPGETMAEHWMEGFLDRLLDPADPVSRGLLAAATLHVVPNMNPDGSRRGYLRTNACGANLNREWLEPTMERSPEVFLVRARMEQTGVDLCLDVHGDEELPHNFIAGSDGIPSLSARQTALLQRYKAELSRLSPDFQTARGYPPAAPGQANLRMCTNWVAERFGCLAMTLEQPFKDAADNPDPRVGWSPERAAHLGRACVGATYAVLEPLRAR